MRRSSSVEWYIKGGQETGTQIMRAVYSSIGKTGLAMTFDGTNVTRVHVGSKGMWTVERASGGGGTFVLVKQVN